jgi:putative CocE/NonD family hydrolase
MTTQPGQQVVVDYDVPARMRDGTTLRANIYRPAGEGQWPVLLTRLPYGKDLPLGSAILDPVQAARRGYVVIVQDTRGRFTSEGDWVPMANEARDGFDTIEWASRLPYSNGQVGMYGASYFGFTQWSAAVEQPPALKTMIPLFTWSDPFNGVVFRGGALELGTMAHWQLQMGMDVLMRRYRNDPQALGRAIALWAKEMDALGKEGYWSLPLKEFRPLKTQEIAPAFFLALEFPMQRAAAEYMNISGKHDRVTVPAFNGGGWYDIFLQDTLEHFTAMRQHGATPQARQSKLLIGPWAHTSQGTLVGEQTFGFASTTAFINLQQDFMTYQLRWFDYWLKGLENGILQEAPIKIFVMGANIWRDEQQWPLARAVETRYYLHSQGHANTLHGDGTLSTKPPEDESADQYTYDPANPVLTRGGALLMAPEYPAGPFDQRPTESRHDVLVYTSAPLQADLEVTGPIRVHLWAVSSAPDTDFVARLVDVHPDGYAQNLTDGIIRARYRHAPRGGDPSLIEPGKAYEYVIDLWSTSNLFKAGHRIRLDITSSNFPRWDRNPNTGQPLGASTEMIPAQQTILHNREHPSYVVLPIVPH